MLLELVPEHDGVRLLTAVLAMLAEVAHSRIPVRQCFTFMIPSWLFAILAR